MNIKYTLSKTIDKIISKEKRNEVKYYCRIGFTLLIIAAVTATLLAFVNALTKERIAQNELAVMQEAIERIYEDSDTVKQIDFSVNEPVTAVYEVYKGDELLGYAVQSSPVGFKDVIGLIVGVDKNNVCVGVEITSISDTPGVGTKVSEPSFLESFLNRDALTIGSVDTISGSTISSAAVKKGIEAVLKLEIPFAETATDVENSELDEDLDQENETPDETEIVEDNSNDNTQPSETQLDAETSEANNTPDSAVSNTNNQNGGAAQ